MSGRYVCIIENSRSMPVVTRMFIKLLILTAYVTLTQCEDCIFDVEHKGKRLQFDMNSFKDLKTMRLNDSTVINIKLCKNNQQQFTCNKIKSKICLIINSTKEIDIGSKVTEVNSNLKGQLTMALEGNTVCEKNKKYSTNITFVCSKNVTESLFENKSATNNCNYILEVKSVAVCPVYDLDIRKNCDIFMPHTLYRFNLNPLRRLTKNYLVEKHNRSFEINFCGYLTYNNKCGGSIATVCDVTNKPMIYAVGQINDKPVFDTESKNIKLKNYDKATKKKSRIVEFIFKCNENISPEKTKPEFIDETTNSSNGINYAYFEVATSTVCIPRMVLCEFLTNDACFNLKPLHNRLGNWVVNETDGGQFYFNVCGYLNQYDDKIPITCKDGKTSACYVDKVGNGISIGSTQIGPYYDGNSILLNYTDGNLCKNTLKWSTVIHFICYGESQLIHNSTSATSCTHVFHWKTPKACKIQFKREGFCGVTHPMYTDIVYNMTDLKNVSYKAFDYENNEQFRFSICSPLRTPCNGNLDSAACWIFNNTEINIGSFNEQLVFDSGKIYMTMQGDKCVNNGPNSYTTIRFVCDHSNSKLINYIKDLDECTFEFIIHTKHACTVQLKINCNVNDKLGNIYDLSKLTKLSSNYEISINAKKKIILNVCHSIINNDLNGANCQLNSGVCLFDDNNTSSASWFSNLGNVQSSPVIKEDKIILEMTNGFYNGHSVSSVIEFICFSKSIGPILKKEENFTYLFQWQTPLACPTENYNNFITPKNISKEPIYPVLVQGLNYSVHFCSRNIENISEQTIILTVEKQKFKYNLIKNSYFVHDSNKTCNEKKNETEKIVFEFICDFELQKPKIYKKMCVTVVYNIDPKMCDEKSKVKTISFLDDVYCFNSAPKINIDPFIQSTTVPTLSTVNDVEKNMSINFNNHQNAEKEELVNSFSLVLIIPGILVTIFLIWFYRLKLLNYVLILSRSFLLVRRRQESYYRDHSL